MIQLLFILLILFSLSPLCVAADMQFYWLIATPQCNKFDIYFDEILRQHNIVHNTDGRMNGKYLAQPILEPMIESWINGSSTESELRESECFKESLEYFKLSLAETHENFTGLGIIRLRSQIEFVLNENIGKYVQLLMTESLQYAKSRWPKAHWAYENILQCVEKNPEGKVVCGSKTRDQDQRFTWLWELQDIIIPQLVFNSEHLNTDNLRLVTEELYEAKGITDKHHLNSTNVIPALSLTEMSFLQRSNQPSSDDYEIEVLTTIVDSGVDKVLLTGNYDFFKNKENCQQFFSYLQNVLGPALNVTRRYKHQMLWPESPMFSYSYAKFAIQKSGSEFTRQPLQVLILFLCLYATIMLVVNISFNEYY